MTIVQIDALNPETAQCFFHGPLTILGRRVHNVLAIDQAIGEFCGDKDVLSLFGVQGQPFANDVFAVGVDICGVPEVVSALVDFV